MLFQPILAGASLRDRLIACLGALLGVALAAAALLGPASALAGLPLLAAPIGASAVLLFAVPASPLAQPWPIVGGNLLSAVVGLAVAQLIPVPALAAGVAVAAAILAMSLARCLHPPGGAVALAAASGSTSVTLLAPVAASSLMLVALGWLFHRASGHSYPHRAAAVARASDLHPPHLHLEDIDRALDDLGETFDVSRADLERLLAKAELHAAARRAANIRAGSSRGAIRIGRRPLQPAADVGVTAADAVSRR